MSGATLTVIQIDDAEVMEALARLQAASGNLAPAYKNIGEELLQSTQARFRASKGPDGQAWAPLSRRTVKAKAAAGHSSAILVMRRYLSEHLSMQADDQSVAVGTAQPYGAIHQFGGTIKKAARTQTLHFKIDRWTGKSGREHVDFRQGFAKAKAANYARDVAIGDHTITIPARPYLGLSADDRAACLTVIADHLRMVVPQLETVNAV